jgi:hypothetical protein
MDYRVALDAGSNYELRGGRIDQVSSRAGIAASTDPFNSDFVLTRIAITADPADVLVDAAGSTAGFEAVLDLDGRDETTSSLALLNNAFVNTSDDSADVGVLYPGSLTVDGVPFAQGHYDASYPFVTGAGFIQVGTAAAIPELASCLLAGLGLVGLLAYVRRRLPTGNGNGHP